MEKELVESFKQFLKAGKVADGISKDLRDEFSVNTGLEVPVINALEDGQDVIVAGSAGSGKTHLIKSVEEREEFNLPEFVYLPSNKPVEANNYIQVILDATALKNSEIHKIFQEESENSQASIMAVNEGPLMELADEYPNSIFRDTLKDLRSAQRGIGREEFDSSMPLLVDVGSYDPIQDNVITQILNLSILEEVVDKLDCCNEGSPCPRREAWKQLKSQEVRQRINDLLRLVHFQGTPILFRELWNFVKDLILGGSCDRNPPTSVWFWRIFNGNSKVSEKLRDVLNPNLVVFPRLESHLYYGDFYFEDIELIVEKDLFVPPLSEAPYDKGDEFNWLKNQLFFLSSKWAPAEAIKDQVDLELIDVLEDSRARGVVSEINKYLSYNTIQASEQKLELWSDLGLEKRTKRPRGQVSFGQVATKDLELRRSLAIVNNSENSVKQTYGSRYFLVDSKSNSSFHLSEEALSLIHSGRSYRTADRRHTDLEWLLANFYSKLADARENLQQLPILNLEFSKMKGNKRMYNLSFEVNNIEREANS